MYFTAEKTAVECARFKGLGGMSEVDPSIETYLTVVLVAPDFKRLTGAGPVFALALLTHSLS